MSFKTDIEIVSFSSFGYAGEIVKIEADLRRGLPFTDIVGLPGSAVKEARERVRAAIRNCGFDFPSGRILINLSPADQKKEGSGFDLPIALSILTAEEKSPQASEDGESSENGTTPLFDAKQTPFEEHLRVMVIGELELSGLIRPVNGVLGAISAGAETGIRHFIVPKENEAEASIPEQVCVFAAATLKDAFKFFYEIKKITPETPSCIKRTDIQKPLFIWSGLEKKTTGFFNGIRAEHEGFEDVRGQDRLIRALEIAAAGRHNLIAYGPPGCGKTLSLQRFLTLLPDMDTKTARETTRIYSIAGLLPCSFEKDILLKRPPFRMPHPNASIEGIIGGAGKCMPGEVSLSHGGVLFLDEASQFKPSVLQTLRAPLETGEVTVSRAGRSSTYPADFQLLLAMNPCPCGNFGTEGKVCTCSPAEVERYWKKLTAPLLDRIDIRIPVFPPKADLFLENKTCKTEKIREKIKKAKEMQWERAQKNASPDYKVTKYENTHLLPKDTPKTCIMSDEAKRVFSSVIEKQKLSGRGSHAVLKISRTIADLDCKNLICSAHLEEALAFRRWISWLPDFL